MKRVIRWRFVVVQLLVVAVGLAPRLAQTETLTARLEWLIDQRRQTLEAASHMTFVQPRHPTVVFDVPPDIHPALTYDFGARYLPGTWTFIFNPKYQAALNRWQEQDDPAGFFTREPELRSTIDHELGHAMAYGEAVRIGQMDWYTGSSTSGASSASRIAVSLLLEGVGCYFQHLVEPGHHDQGYMSLPHGWNDPLWGEIHRAQYEGGSWIVYPILAEFGQRGLDYLLSHPLPLDDGLADDRGLAYQQAALRNLRQAQ